MNIEIRSFKLKFILRQHTPIIHFQWHEKDASLRPTELKAKLDKWIIASMTGCYGNSDSRLEKVKSKENDQFKFPDIYKWIKGAKSADKTHPTLNYSVKLIPFNSIDFSSVLDTKVVEKDKEVFKKHLNKKVKEKVKEVVNKDYPTYFGNQLKVDEFETGAKRIKRLTFHKGVQLIITSPYSDLIAKIKEVFPEFILKTNFGTRQSKGFGSFFIEKGTNGFPANHHEWFKGKFDWMFDLGVSGSNEQAKIKDLFANIDLFYKTLRSGINTSRFGGVYFKSLMFQYVKDKLQKQWDKKTIKMKYFLNASMSLPQNEAGQKADTSYLDRAGKPMDPECPLFWEGGSNSEKLLWRDLLGLSSEQQWMGYNPNRIVKKHFAIGNQTEITRFKSPIIFKPIRTGVNSFRVYFEVPDFIKDAFKDASKRLGIEDAEILSKQINIDTKVVNNPTWGIKFPNTFDFDEFIKFAISQHPKNQVHNTGHHSTSAYKDLLKIKVTKA